MFPLGLYTVKVFLFLLSKVTLWNLEILERENMFVIPFTSNQTGLVYPGKSPIQSVVLDPALVIEVRLVGDYLMFDRSSSLQNISTVD